MKKMIIISMSLLLISLLCLPPSAEASRWRHGHGHGGGAIIGFGAGLMTGFLFAPRAIVVSPPVRVVPPPVYYAPYAAVPAAPPVYSYSASAPQPGAQAMCREWRLLERRYQDSWDSYSGRWRTIPVEKWGWVEVSCGN